MYDQLYVFEDKHWWSRARKDILMSLIYKYYRSFCQSNNRRGRGRVLDIGCGTGMMLRYLSKYGDVLGIDKDPKAVSYARKKVPDAEIIAGSFPEGIPGGKFSLITILDVLEHIEEDTKALGFIGDLLEVSGIAIITVPAFPFLWSAHDDLSRHKRRYRMKELEEKIKDAGLYVIKISYYNTLLFLPSATVKIARRIFPDSSLGSRLYIKTPAVPINLLLKTIFSSEKFLLQFISFPFGISIVAVVSKNSDWRHLGATPDELDIIN